MRRTLITIACAALLALAATAATPSPETAPAPAATGRGFSATELNKRCDFPAPFPAFSRAVWDRGRWERGRPGDAAIHAQRRRLACAAPDRRFEMHQTWRALKHRYESHRGHCEGGLVVEGRDSFYSGGMTGDGVHNASEPGIAIRDTSTYGEYFRVTTQRNPRGVLLMHFDWGPASWTGRAIDVTESGAAELGGLTTDEWARAQLIPGDCL